MGFPWKLRQQQPIHRKRLHLPPRTPALCRHAERFVPAAGPGERVDQEAILGILRDDRQAHLKTDETLLAAHLADAVVEISNGEIHTRPSSEIEVFFAQYLQTGGLMDRLCQGTPLAYNSNNAPKERDLLGTIVLSVLNGQTRYAHINALRGDRVGVEVLGVSKLVSMQLH